MNQSDQAAMLEELLRSQAPRPRVPDGLEARILSQLEITSSSPGRSQIDDSSREHALPTRTERNRGVRSHFRTRAIPYLAAIAAAFALVAAIRGGLVKSSRPASRTSQALVLPPISEFPPPKLPPRLPSLDTALANNPLNGEARALKRNAVRTTEFLIASLPSLPSHQHPGQH